MDIIYNHVKAGKPVNPSEFREVATHLFRRESECNILGCTELSLLKRDYAIGEGFLDALEVLAKASIVACEAPLKSDYRCLITRQ